MLITNKYPCPRCREPGTNVGRTTSKTLIHTWYACGKCRHRWRTTSDGQGYNVTVTAELPHTERKQASLGALSELSPCCGAPGRVRDTWRDERGYFRKHLCRACEKPFYTCTIEPSGRVIRYAVRPANVRSQLEVT